ncbi:MAG: FKBP-type peptidyl-prolyl cis-trans isomerase [Gammaproteobacteria bacterium]
MKLAAVSILGLSLACANVYAANPGTVTTSTTTTSEQKQMQPTQMTGEAFLEANKSKPGVVVLPSGLQYKIITEGSGASPKATDVVTVNYAGTLVNGTEFDSSYKRGQPASFPVNGVIAGWVEALQLMKPGATWELYIPAALAYGSTGAPPVIGPNEVLIFKVELLNVQKR